MMIPAAIRPTAVIISEPPAFKVRGLKPELMEVISAKGIETFFSAHGMRAHTVMARLTALCLTHEDLGRAMVILASADPAFTARCLGVEFEKLS